MGKKLQILCSAETGETIFNRTHTGQKCKIYERKEKT